MTRSSINRRARSQFILAQRHLNSIALNAYSVSGLFRLEFQTGVLFFLLLVLCPSAGFYADTLFVLQSIPDFVAFDYEILGNQHEFALINTD